MITRRGLLSGMAATAGMGLLGLDARPAAAEPPPETTRIRLSKVPSVCVAPQYVAEEFLTSEGFTDVRYVGEKGAGVGGIPLAKAMGAGEVDIAMNFAAPLVVSLDAGEPIVLLGGVHVGCFELFGSERVRTISDLKGKTVAVPQLNSPQHTFIASIVTQIGLDPNRDITWREHPPAEAKQLLGRARSTAFSGSRPTLRSCGPGRSGGSCSTAPSTAPGPSTSAAWSRPTVSSSGDTPWRPSAPSAPSSRAISSAPWSRAGARGHLRTGASQARRHMFARR